MPRKAGFAALALGVALFGSVAACSRVTFLRPDASRGDFRRTAPEVDIRTDGSARSTAIGLVRASQDYLAAGDAKSALESARRALRIDGDSADAHSLVGLSLDALGQAPAAGQHHRRAAEIAPTRGALLNNYGTWLCANGKAPESLQWFERATVAPGYPTPELALANAGACGLQAGDVDRAHALLRQAISIAPSNPLALRALAEAELRRGRAFEARAFIERRLAAAPADAEALLLASQIEQQLGDTAAAARYVQRIRAEFPRNSDSAREGGNP
jgi:type IV pilus assembly protein PilF